MGGKYLMWQSWIRVENWNTPLRSKHQIKWGNQVGFLNSLTHFNLPALPLKNELTRQVYIILKG